MASFRFAEDCSDDEQAGTAVDDYSPTLPQARRGRGVPQGRIFSADTVAQLRASAASGAVLEQLGRANPPLPRVAPEAARGPGQLLFGLGLLAVALYFSR